MRNYNVGVTVLAPGFVSSGEITHKLTRGKPQTLPFVVSEARAIDVIKDAIERNVAVVSFPFIMYFWTHAVGGLPFSLQELVRPLARLRIRAPDCTRVFPPSPWTVS